MNAEVLTTIIGNGVLLAVIVALAVELRKDVREIRDKVLILWEAHEQKGQNRREGDVK